MAWHTRAASLTALLLLLAGLLGPVGLPPRRASADTFAARDATLDEAELARRNGDYDGAAAILRLLVAEADPETAREALLQLGVVLIEAGRAAEAAASARELLGREEETAMRARATVVLGRAQRAGGDCAGALASFAEAQRLGSPLGPYLDLQMADCHARLKDRVGQADRAARALAQAGGRLIRLDALEHQVDAALKRGDREAALRVSEQLLATAGTPTYRAQTLTSVGNLAAEIGRRDEAIRAYATAVAELPETSFAAEAFDALARLDALGAVDYDHAGLVHHFHGRHERAVAAFATALEWGLPRERAARALYHQGRSLLRLERLEEAVVALEQVASLIPESDLAAPALVRAGQALEAAGRLDAAAARYRQAADSYPGSWAGQDARQRLVLSHVLRGDAPEAVRAARELAGGGADARWKALALFWAGKALARAGDGAQAAAILHEAAGVDPDSFGGLRARAILDGDSRATSAAGTLDAARLAPTLADQAELDAWLARHGTTAATLAGERAADPNYARAGELFRVGLREQGRWELEEVGARAANDPARLYRLAQFAHDLGEPQLGIRYAVEARRATGEPLHAQPRLLQMAIMPLPYPDLILANAEQHGLDPLLIAALIRQESTFSASARSSANALGLAQVLPSTGRAIARALGRSDFTTDDLLRPIVSVELGAHHLASQLTAFGGLTYPALAAYNAGGGPVNGWLRQFGAADADLFAERIPYPETSDYVRVVYENYRLYRRLYGD